MNRAKLKIKRISSFLLPPPTSKFSGKKQHRRQWIQRTNTFLSPVLCFLLFCSLVLDNLCRATKKAEAEYVCVHKDIIICYLAIKSDSQRFYVFPRFSFVQQLNVTFFYVRLIYFIYIQARNAFFGFRSVFFLFKAHTVLLYIYSIYVFSASLCSNIRYSCPLIYRQFCCAMQPNSLWKQRPVLRSRILIDTLYCLCKLKNVKRNKLLK